MRRRCWLVPGVLILLTGCGDEEVTGPANDGPPPTELRPPVNRALVAAVTMTVDPTSGDVTLSNDRRGTEGPGPLLSVAPLTSSHLRVVRTVCEGCSDRTLDNQVITVTFALRDFILDDVDLHRIAGDAKAATTCGNCRVRSAEIQRAGYSPHQGPGEVFDVVLEVEALEHRPFSVHFDLNARRIAATTCLAPGITRLHPPGAGWSRAIDVNNAGQVLVASDAANFVWSPAGGFRTVPIDEVRAINDSGVVVGSNGGWSAARAVLWSAAAGLERLPTPAGYGSSRAHDINNAGVIVGGGSGPILWTADGFQQLELFGDPEDDYYFTEDATAINDRGDVIGEGWAESYTFAVLWRDAPNDGTVTDSYHGGGGDGNRATDINNAGQVTTNAVYEYEYGSYVWTPETGEQALLESDASSVYALNDHGVVVGSILLRSDVDPYDPSVPLPMRWTSEVGIEQLPLLPGSASGGALGINEAGYIVGEIDDEAVIWSPDTCTIDSPAR